MNEDRLLADVEIDELKAAHANEIAQLKQQLSEANTTIRVISDNYKPVLQEAIQQAKREVTDNIFEKLSPLFPHQFIDDKFLEFPVHQINGCKGCELDAIKSQFIRSYTSDNTQKEK